MNPDYHTTRLWLTQFYQDSNLEMATFYRDQLVNDPDVPAELRQYADEVVAGTTQAIQDRVAEMNWVEVEDGWIQYNRYNIYRISDENDRWNVDVRTPMSCIQLGSNLSLADAKKYAAQDSLFGENDR